MKKILYITYCDMDNLESGSRVRPRKIYDAFIERGYTVKLLGGVASKEKKDQRIKNIYEIMTWLDSNTPSFCYIESPSDPIVFKEDRQLIKKIHQKGIKIGYFYRDAYYKFGKKYFFQEGLSLKKTLKFFYYKLLNYRDDLIIKKNVDVVFVPSVSAKIIYKSKNTVVLPPGGEKKEIVENNKVKDLIYVGGISDRYGTSLLLEAMEIVNQEDFITLNLVCRKSEMENIPAKYFECKWLKIHNISGNELDKLYQKSKIALMPLKPDFYNNMALPIKLFEYISYNLPIVSTNLNEVDLFINKYNVGLVSSYDANDFAKKILELYNDEKLYNSLQKNIKKALDENQWVNRVDKIDEELSK